MSRRGSRWIQPRIHTSGVRWVGWGDLGILMVHCSTSQLRIREGVTYRRCRWGLRTVRTAHGRSYGRYRFCLRTVWTVQEGYWKIRGSLTVRTVRRQKPIPSVGPAVRGPYRPWQQSRNPNEKSQSRRRCLPIAILAHGACGCLGSVALP